VSTLGSQQRRSRKEPLCCARQSSSLTVANKQLELMARYMTEFGMTPASRSRVAALDPRMQVEMPTEIVLSFVSPDGTVTRPGDPGYDDIPDTKL